MDPLTAAIVGSVISAAAESLLAPPPPEISIGVVRMLPAESKVGIMKPPAHGLVMIDGKPFMLSPGVQIRDESNTIIFQAMVQSAIKVRYQTDHIGAVHRVWILSATEARLPENQ